MQKAIVLSMASLTLAACSGLAAHQFHGESATFGGDNILRNDVVAMIQQRERLQFSCPRLDRIDAKIDDVRRVQNRIHAQETWLVQACGATHRYHVTLREDGRGETDFSVGLR